jgi:hypothetical protein
LNILPLVIYMVHDYSFLGSTADFVIKKGTFWIFTGFCHFQTSETSGRNMAVELDSRRCLYFIKSYLCVFSIKGKPFYVTKGKHYMHVKKEVLCCNFSIECAVDLYRFFESRTTNISLHINITRIYMQAVNFIFFFININYSVVLLINIRNWNETFFFIWSEIKYDINSKTSFKKYLYLWKRQHNHKYFITKWIVTNIS